MASKFLNQFSEHLPLMCEVKLCGTNVMVVRLLGHEPISGALGSPTTNRPPARFGTLRIRATPCAGSGPAWYGICGLLRVLPRNHANMSHAWRTTMELYQDWVVPTLIDPSMRNKRLRPQTPLLEDLGPGRKAP